MTGLTAEIALDGATFSFDKLYSYSVPADLHKNAKIGCRVTVPFGKGNSKKQGMVLRLRNGEIRGLKHIISFIDSQPVLTDEMCEMVLFMKENCFCTYYDAVRSMLPAGLNYKLVDYYSANPDFTVQSSLNSGEGAVYSFLLKKGETVYGDILKKFPDAQTFLTSLEEKSAVIKSRDPKRRMNDKTQKFVRLNDEIGELDDLKTSPRRREVLEFVKTEGCVSVKEIMYYTGVTASVINGLVDAEMLIAFEKQVYRSVNKITGHGDKKTICLTDEQSLAYNGLLSDYESEKGKVALLYGITGSGKTSVFLKLVDKVSESGRGVIVMVPEISLTPQMLEIFTRRYGEKVAVFHSAMSTGKRMDEWKRIKEGKAVIALGTRSAIFAPFKDLGLIIIDEEHEYTYKSEQSPRFHTRDLAKFRTAYGKGLLCLSSATPSVESFTLAKSGKYSLYKLEKRYGNAVLPDVETVDMRKEAMSGNTSSISRRLYEALDETLKKGHQAILLLNRRGHNTYISCPECGYVATCPNCSVSLTYHSANNRLMCHYCGYSVTADKKCPQCLGEHMKFLGLGTQKSAEELQNLFPDKKILRLDADSTLARESYSGYLNAFSEKEYDILLGTQMVAKGLDFPNVTLVGVLGADSAMFSEDFRSYERTFSLLTQVVGRAGRGGDKGLAVIQTYDPSSDIINLAAKQDYEGFYNNEILTRKVMVYPPYCDICSVYVKSLSKNEAEMCINRLFAKIKEQIKNEFADVKLIILGPTAATVPKINNKYRFRMLIKCRADKRFKEMLRRALEIKNTGDVTVSVDINPETVT